MLQVVTGSDGAREDTTSATAGHVVFICGPPNAGKTHVTRAFREPDPYVSVDLGRQGDSRPSAARIANPATRRGVRCSAQQHRRADRVNKRGRRRTPATVVS